MIIEAKKSNACAIKFQMHDLDDEMLKKTPKSKNFKKTLYETLKKTNFTTEQHIKLKNFVKNWYYLFALLFQKNQLMCLSIKLK